MSELTIVFTAKEILEQIHRELYRLGIGFNVIPLEEWKKYILARTLEDILLIDLTPAFDPAMEDVANKVRSEYRRCDGEETFTIHEDVGSNKLFPYLRTRDLPFESDVQLYRHRVVVGARKRN